MYMLLIALGRQINLMSFEASLVYRPSSLTARIQKNLVSKGNVLRDVTERITFQDL